MNDPHPPLLTYQDFQAFIADKPGRYEFVNGQVVALASPSKPHGRLAGALYARLREHLSGRQCDVTWTLTYGQERTQDDLIYR